MTPASIAATVKMGSSATRTLTMQNTGGLPASVRLGESDGGFVIAAKNGARKQTVKTTVFNGSATVHAAKIGRKAGANARATTRTVAPSADAWAPVADLPTPVQDGSAVFSGGKLYSVGGYNGADDIADLYAFDPQTASWTKLSSATVPREAGRVGDVAGSLVWTGGWGPGGDPTGVTELYDTAGDAWSLGAENPKPYSAAGVAVVGTKMYLIGGCTGSACGTTDVQVYDAAADSWASAAAYPEPIAWEACGAINGKVYCAGGNTDASSVTSAYSYDPAADSWAPVADLPADLWGSFSTAANGQLLVSGGVIDNSSAITNTGYAYDPANDTWSALPNLNAALYRGSGAVGFYAVGGNPGGAFAAPVATTQLLAGYDQGGTADVPWLGVDPTELTLEPGASAIVTVTLDASDPSIAQPGVYTAAVTVASDTPYAVPNVAVTMTATPPSTWGKIAGTVSTNGAGGSTPVPGATVELDSWAASYTLTTDASGTYAIWIDRRNNPLTAIVAKDGYKPQTAKLRVVAGSTVTKNWVLVKR